jgi:hypothetical protein
MFSTFTEAIYFSGETPFNTYFRIKNEGYDCKIGPA